MSAEASAWQCERRHTCIISERDWTEMMIEPRCTIVINGEVCGGRLVTKLYELPRPK